ncbi:MAG TPA: AMP-binding protein [Candidatus Sulfotelmatobacter sp.]
MIYVHSLGRALRFYPGRTALARDGRLLTFRELHSRVEGTAATLTSHGFGVGDRLALLLPNGPDYIELIYACSMLGVITVPLNTRLSAKEIDGVLEDARPHGIIRHSSLAVPGAQLKWQHVIDKQPLPISSDPVPNIFYDPEAVLGLIYTSGTTGQPKGVMVTHGNILADVHNFNYWMRYTEGGIYLHAAPIFHIADFPSMFAAPAFGACQITIPKFSAQTFCETVEREHECCPFSDTNVQFRIKKHLFLYRSSALSGSVSEHLAICRRWKLSCRSTNEWISLGPNSKHRNVVVRRLLSRQ